MFYVSLKGTCDSGLLQEAYEGSKLKEKGPLALLKERMPELAAQGKKVETTDDDNDDWDDDNEQDDDSLRVSLCMLSWVYYWDLHINLIHSLKCAYSSIFFREADMQVQSHKITASWVQQKRVNFISAKADPCDEKTGRSFILVCSSKNMSSEHAAVSCLEVAHVVFISYHSSKSESATHIPLRVLSN